jgi:site-specific DNA-methyltransferase (adenine-specific)
VDNARQNAAVVMTAAQPFTSMLGASRVRDLKYSWVWEKSAATGHLNVKKMPIKNHEDVLVFYKKPPTYNPQELQPYGEVTRRGNNGGCYGKSGCENVQEHTGYPRTIQAFKSEGKTVHPTQKPVALFAYLISTHTNLGETVLDFCAGSGTTAVAAESTGRKWVLVEKEEKYCETIAKRLGAKNN